MEKKNNGIYIGIFIIFFIAILFIDKVSNIIIMHDKELAKEKQVKARTDYETQMTVDLSELFPSIMANMVLCSSGTFIMGSPKDEIGRRDGDKELQHQVTISKPFYIGKYEVTQKEYISVMGENPSKFLGENRPVENVTWYDAKEFCKKMNNYVLNEKAKEIPKNYIFDLPTEAQWEYACRAGTTTSLCTGKNITSERNRCSNADEVAWYYYNSGNETHDVGLKKPNAWGIFDMHGNVREWCRDKEDDYPPYAVIDPIGTSESSNYVVRGGPFSGYTFGVRSADRCGSEPNYRINVFGFRLALVPID